MIRINLDAVSVWADRVNVPDKKFAELDLRLTAALEGIYSDPYLRGLLAFKGGTALNKAYFGESARLSVDLDFNVVGPRKETVKQIAKIRRAVQEVLRGQDPAYEFKYDYFADQTTIFVRYAPLSGAGQATIKVDISVRESTPILGIVEKEIATPDGTTPIKVRTYSLDELMAGKIRALYARKKGRDAFDVDRALGMELTREVIRKLVYYQFYLGGEVFNWKVFEANLKAKAEDKRFGQDIAPYLKPGSEFQARRAVEKFLAAFDGLGQPDRRDEEFLALAKVLVGRTVSAAKIAKTTHITHPVKHLMDSIPITPEAAALTVDDIKLEQPKR